MFFFFFHSFFLFLLQTTANISNIQSMESNFHPPFTTVAAAITTARLLPLHKQINVRRGSADCGSTNKCTNSSVRNNRTLAMAGPPSAQPINDACRWSSNADESYDGGGDCWNGRTVTNSHGRYCAETTSDDGSSNRDGRSGNSNDSDSICDVVDSSVRYGIEAGDIHRNNNNNHNTNSIDLEFGSSRCCAVVEKCDGSPPHGERTVINYMLRDIANGLAIPMDALVGWSKYAALSGSRILGCKSSIISLVIYMLLLTAATRPCDAHKHEGTLSIHSNNTTYTFYILHRIVVGKLKFSRTNTHTHVTRIRV